MHCVRSLTASHRYTDFIVTQVAKQAIQKLPGGLTISKLSKDDSLKQGGAFAALAAWALIQAGACFSGQRRLCGSWQPKLPHTALLWLSAAANNDIPKCVLPS